MTRVREFAPRDGWNAATVPQVAASGKSSRFGAAGSALGYLAQVEYGLLLVLRRMDDEVTLRLSMETADDIEFDDPSGIEARELWQTKHHLVRRGSLGNSSPDIWKSLHNWIETAENDCELVLFSTASASAATAAALLAQSRTADDVRAAQQQLEAVARKAGNDDHAAYYTRFLDLTADQRFELLCRVTILGGASRATDMTDQLVASVRKTVPALRRRALVERLRGWWHARAIQHLDLIATGSIDWIDMVEVENQLHRIAQSLRDENLPLDYGDLPEPTPEEAAQDDRVFVEQLRLIMLHHERIRMAVYDHNRAFEQRSRWQREHLLDPEHLKDYDRLLVEEWKRVFLPIEEPPSADEQDEEASRRAALNRYMALGQRPLPEVRPEVRSGYIPLGSLHILADRLEIGWHPDWLRLLTDRLDSPESEMPQPGVA